MAGKMEKLPNKKPRPIEGHKPAAAILRGVVDKVYANAWEAKKRGELVGWSSSKFPIELAKAFGSDNSSKFINGVLGTAFKQLGLNNEEGDHEGTKSQVKSQPNASEQ